MYNEVKLAVENSLNTNKIICDIYTLRFIKPFDDNFFKNLVSTYDCVLFVEDGIKTGGISEYLFSLLGTKLQQKSKILAFEDKFYPQGSREEVLECAFLSSKNIESAILELSKC